MNDEEPFEKERYINEVMPKIIEDIHKRLKNT